MTRTDGAAMTAGRIRLLGFAPLAGLDALLAALSAVPGPAVQAWPGPAREGAGVAALLQAEPDEKASLFRDRAALLAGLGTVQRRLEIGCQAGPFLPMDPAAACCPSGVPRAALDAAWDGLAAALARHGARHQWDIVLRWPPEGVLARQRDAIAAAAAGRGAAGLADAVAAALRAERARREAALLAALAPAVLALAAGGAAGTDTEVAVTVLLPARGETAAEAALEALAPEHVAEAVIDMRGPLPPLHFAAVRLASATPAAITAAWRRLDLPARVDRDLLRQHWRLGAAANHPDRHPADPARAAAAVAGITEAYHLLRDLLPGTAASGGITLDGLLGRAGHRLILPDNPPQEPCRDGPAGVGMATRQPDAVLEALS